MITLDTLNLISEFLNLKDYMYNFSLVCKEYVFKLKRNNLIRDKCANKLHNLITSNLCKSFLLSENLNKVSLIAMTKNLVNKLFNFIPFQNYSYKLSRYITAKKYIFSNTLYGNQYTSVYIKVHSVYRCSFVQFSNIKSNLLVKALIY